MAKKRARAQKKREDYRKGGRVGYNGEGDGGGFVIDSDMDPDTNAGIKPTSIRASAPAPAPTPKAFTQADVDKAVADLNAGADPETIGAQYGFTGAQISTALAEINKASGYTAPAAFDLASIPADGEYTPEEAAQVTAAINAKTITAEQAATQFGVTADQITTEIKRGEAVARGETLPENIMFTPETPPEDRYTDAQKELFDPYADTTLRNMEAEQAEAASQAAASDVAESVTFKDKAGEEAFVPGDFLKTYSPVDKAKLVQEQTAVAIDRTGTKTPATAIKQLSVFDDINIPDKAVAAAITKSVATIKEAVTLGTVSPSNYETALADNIAATVPAFAGAPKEAIIAELRALTDPAKAEQISEAEATSRKASGVDYVIDAKTFVPSVEGTTAQVSDTPEAEAATRAAITGTAASGVDAQIINTIGFEARQRAVVTGTAAVGAAANALAAIGEIPAAIAAATVEDPASVAAIIDTEPVEVATSDTTTGETETEEVSSEVGDISNFEELVRQSIVKGGYEDLDLFNEEPDKGEMFWRNLQDVYDRVQQTYPGYQPTVDDIGVFASMDDLVLNEVFKENPDMEIIADIYFEDIDDVIGTDGYKNSYQRNAGDPEFDFKKWYHDAKACPLDGIKSCKRYFKQYTEYKKSGELDITNVSEEQMELAKIFYLRNLYYHQI